MIDSYATVAETTTITVSRTALVHAGAHNAVT